MPQPGLRDPIGFNRASLVALLILVAVISVIAGSWPELAAAEWNAIFGRGGWAAHMDWLLAGLGIFFFVCTALDPNPRHDLATIAAGMLGGAIIEVWGTRAGLWYYYTGERPPLWILPAWGMSALSNEKMQRLSMTLLPHAARENLLTDREGSGLTRACYFATMALLVSFYLYWSWPAISHPYTFFTTTLIVAALASPRYPAYAFSLFLNGALLGIFLEIWGTGRHCWNYYDGKTPSPFPIFGHGIAALCFWKMKDSGRKVWGLVAAKLPAHQ